jgi:hypothetical protein
MAESFGPVSVDLVMAVSEFGRGLAAETQGRSSLGVDGEIE